MRSRKLQYLELSLYCAAVGACVIGFWIADDHPADAAAFMLSALCMFAAGVAVDRAQQEIRKADREAGIKPLWVRVHESPLLSVYYCQECTRARAWWHCCRHELNLCYGCLMAHDAPPECYYIPAHRARPIDGLRLRCALGQHEEEEA